MDDQTSAQRQMTEGEYRVGVSFNPGGNPLVDKIKKLTAELIDLLDPIHVDLDHPGYNAANHAMFVYEGAAMWAVKAVTKPER